MTTLIQTRIEDSIGRITLNHTAKKNALRFEMYESILAALDSFEKADEVQAVVITGNGGNFSSGFDVTEGAPSPARDFIKNVSSKASRRLWYFPKPTIAVVEGYCVGGGFELAMGADLVYAAEDAQLGEPEIDFFFTPDFNSIPCIALPRKAKEMILLGQVVSGIEAEEIGLINRAVPMGALMDEVDAVCRRLVSLPRSTLSMAKVGLNGALDAQGFANAIAFGEEIAASNAETNRTNADCQAFHQAVAEHGLKHALNLVRSQGIWAGR